MKQALLTFTQALFQNDKNVWCIDPHMIDVVISRNPELNTVENEKALDEFVSFLNETKIDNTFEEAYSLFLKTSITNSIDSTVERIDSLDTKPIVDGIISLFPEYKKLRSKMNKHIDYVLDNPENSGFEVFSADLLANELIDNIISKYEKS